MKTFKINDEYEIACEHQNTRSGFRHVAILLKDGEEIDRTKICYQNRTWERFNFESVLHKLFDKTDVLNDEQAKEFLDCIAKDDFDRVAGIFNSIKMVCAVGEVLTDDKKEQNDWKKKMISAGLGEGVSFPDDWDSLSEDEKQRRLDGAVEVAQ